MVAHWWPMLDHSFFRAEVLAQVGTVPAKIGAMSSLAQTNGGPEKSELACLRTSVPVAWRFVHIRARSVPIFVVWAALQADPPLIFRRPSGAPASISSTVMPGRFIQRQRCLANSDWRRRSCRACVARALRARCLAQRSRAAASRCRRARAARSLASRRRHLGVDRCRGGGRAVGPRHRSGAEATQSGARVGLFGLFGQSTTPQPLAPDFWRLRRPLGVSGKTPWVAPPTPWEQTRAEAPNGAPQRDVGGLRGGCCCLLAAVSALGPSESPRPGSPSDGARRRAQRRGQAWGLRRPSPRPGAFWLGPFLRPLAPQGLAVRQE